MDEDTDTPADNAVPEILYHYCGVNAFHGIVTSKQLWLSNATFTNDYMEHRWLIEKARKELEDRAKTSGNRDRLTELATMLTDANVPYICCLSPEGDLLSQWRGYSDDGAGFAIGFSGSSIQATCKGYPNPTAIALRKVEYVEGEQEQLLKQYLDNYCDECAQGRTLSTERASIGIWTCAAVCKNPGFREENEWRIVWMPSLRKVGEYDASSIRFRVAGDRVLPYFAFRFRPEMIQEIYLGPKNYARENRKPLEMFLRGNQYDVDRIKIENSKATYR